MNPIYAIDKTYLENAQRGPFFQEKIPERIFPPENEWLDFLGYRVASPIGIPAGPLLNAEWLLFAARMGYDVLTYKTIRSHAHPAHPLPNMVYVETKGDLDQFEEPVFPRESPPETMAELAATNSFGNPSLSPDFLREDIAKARAGLSKGQLLIVSVFGVPQGEKSYIEEFVDASLLAKEAGAHAIELNLSCPNVTGKEGVLYVCPSSVYEVTSAVKRAVGDLPIIIKVGLLFEYELIEAVMVEADRAGAEAICGINTISREFLDHNQQPFLGEERRRAGICGAPILKAALQFVRLAKKANRMGMAIMGTGGVYAPEHFDLFFEAGADIAMTALGMMWDPWLAINYHGRKCAATVCN